MSPVGEEPPAVKLPRVATAARRPLYEVAAEAIREAILTGKFEPGERLYEPDLARELNLSRGPVREALRKLEQEGIVTSSPHLGSTVVRLDDREVLDALHLREVLETMSCDRIVELVTDEDLKRLDRLVEEMCNATEACDIPRLAETDLAFHDQLISIGRSGLTHRMWRSISGVLRISLAVTDPIFVRRDGDIRESHMPILKALRKRDAKALERSLSDHMSNVKPLLRSAQQ